MHKKFWIRPAYFVGSLLLFFLLLPGCGKGFKDLEDRQEEIVPEHFVAILEPLNRRVAQFKGWVEVTISENQFWIRIKVEGNSDRIMHAQYLHAYSRCPTEDADVNGDGYIDFLEAHRDVGPILIPLDGNLNSQLKGMNTYPEMKRQGFYYYSRSTAIDRLMRDLYRQDNIPDDMMTKLKRHESLSLDERVIMIYGIPEGRNLPASVQSYSVYPSQFTLPVACGRLRQGDTTYFSEVEYSDDAR